MKPLHRLNQQRGPTDMRAAIWRRVGHLDRFCRGARDGYVGHVGHGRDRERRGLG